MPLDFSKLLNIRSGANGSKTAGCPACMESGGDHDRTHLIIFPDGRYGCVVNQRDPAHRRRIWQLVGIGGTQGNHETIRFTPGIKPELPKTWPVSSLDRLIKNFSYWEGRGIREETVSKFGGGIATQGQMKGRFVFPIFSENNQIIGFTGRGLIPAIDPKWKHLGSVENWLWGNLEEIKLNKKAILVESIGDILALNQAGVNYCICLFGVNISEKIISFLIGHGVKKIYISTNNDIKEHKRGQKSALEIYKKLINFFDAEGILISLPNVENKKDFGEMTEEEIMEWQKSLDKTEEIKTLSLDEPKTSRETENV